MNICVIPARGGSKRIPRKNIKDFNGKPIIAYSIEAALKSNCFDQVIVSTDSEEIADISEKYGAKVPFIRPKELSDDFTPTRDVINHAIRWFLDQEMNMKYVCCLYATAPLIRQRYLKEGLKKLKNSDKSFAFSVTSFAFPIQRAIKISDGEISMFYPQHLKTRSQDLQDAYHDAGQFYWGRFRAFLNNEIMFSKRSIPIILPRNLVQDIDTLEDWTHAEFMHKALSINL